MKMSKAEKEAALNAKIAAIRAKNEALKRRHEEVQADKKEAEKIESSVTCSNKDFHYEKRKTPPLGVRSRLGRGRAASGTSNGGTGGTGAERRGGNDVKASPRLKESPPPDPSYRFLADRMRDGSSSPSSSENEQEPLQPINLDSLKPEKRKEILSKIAQDENRSPSRRRGFNRRYNVNGSSSHNRNNGHHDASWSDDRNGLILREIRADSVTTKYISGDKKKHSKNRSYYKGNNEPQSSREGANESFESNKNIEEGSLPSNNPQTLEMSANAAEWVPQPSTSEEPVQSSWSTHDWNHDYYPPGDTNEWQLPTSWAEEVANEENEGSTVEHSSQENWYGTPLHYISLPPHFAAAPPHQYSMQSMYSSPTTPANMPLGHDYYAYHYQQIPSHNSAASVVVSSNGVKGISMGPSTEEVSSVLTHTSSTKSNSKGSYHNSFKNNRYHNGSRSDNWRSREVSKIPPRFQKQKPSERYNKIHVNTTSSLAIPKASSNVAPPGCDRLTIFAIPNIIDRLAETILYPQLTQRLIPVRTLEDFKRTLSQIDPQNDYFVLIHVLDNDARDISRNPNQNDVEKGIDSDNLANEFCDIVEAILHKIPYLRIFLSTMLPRFDSPESQGLSFPNNIRKVMNVQISTRLKTNPKVFFLNNDQTLDFLQDEAKMLSLYTDNGHVLSKHGFDCMVEAWKTNINNFIAEEKLLEGHSDSKLINDLNNMDVRESQETDQENSKENK